MGAFYQAFGPSVVQDGLGTDDAVVIAVVFSAYMLPSVLGAPVGFVVGIFAVEATRSRDRAQAWARTKSALWAILHSMGIELITAFVIAVIFVVGVILT